MKLTYKPLPNDDILRVVCEGTVSVRGRPPGSEPLQELLGPHAYRQRVVLNLERADGADTSGLMWLVKASSRFGQGSGKLSIYGFTPTFKQMLEVLGLLGTVLLASSEQNAIDSVSRSAQEMVDRVVAGEVRPAPRAYNSPPDAEVG